MNTEKKFMKVFYKMSTKKKVNFFKDMAKKNGMRHKKIREFFLLDEGSNGTIVVHTEGGMYRNYKVPFDFVVSQLEKSNEHDNELISNIWKVSDKDKTAEGNK